MGGIDWIVEGLRLIMATGNRLIEYEVPGFIEQAELNLPSNGTRVAWDALRERCVVTFRGENMVRIYQRHQP
jgi:hypothetical protein